MTGEFQVIESPPAKEPKFAFFRASRYGFFAFSASQTDVPASLPFAALSPRLKAKFRNAGVRATEQARTSEDAQNLYQQLPRSARLSEDHIGKFLQTRDASHIKNHGGTQVARKDGFNSLNAADNLLWEDSRTNRRRGGRDMTDTELLNARNAILGEGAMMFVSNALFAGLRSGYIAASLEIPLSTLEDYATHNGHVSISTVAKKTGMVGLAGVISGCTVHSLLYLVPDSFLHSDLFKMSTTILGTLGVASYLWELGVRLRKAASVKRPENQLVTIVL